MEQDFQEPKFIVEVLFNFDATDKQHLSLKQYEKVRVIQTHESQWWIGEKENGEVGLFPANYARRVNNINNEQKKKEKTFQRPITFEPQKSNNKVNEELERKKKLASEIGLSSFDLDDLDISDDDELISDEDSSSDNNTEPQKKPQAVGFLSNNGKFVSEDAYEKKKAELQDVLEKLKGEERIKLQALEEVKKLKESLEKANNEINELKNNPTTPRSYGSSNSNNNTKKIISATTAKDSTKPSVSPRQQEIQQQQLLKQQQEFEKKQKEMEREYQEKTKKLLEEQRKRFNEDFEKRVSELQVESKNSAELENMLTNLKLKSKQQEDKISQLTKFIQESEVKYNQELKLVKEKSNVLQQNALFEQRTRIMKLKKQAGALKGEKETLKKEMQALMKHTLLSINKISNGGLKQMEETVQQLNELYKKELKERRKLYNELQDLKGNIRVNLRVRPLLNEETEACVECFSETKEVKLIDKENRKIYKFEFDNVFGIDSTQEEVFEDVKPLATSILDGYNVCIFAYGQTGSGKTFTMEGPMNNRGVNYRTLDELFEMIKERKLEYSYTVEVAVMEIYNENLHDLLTKEKTKLDILMSNKVSIPNLSKRTVNSSEDVRKVLSSGYENRAVGNNNVNVHSSRSHCIVSVFVEGINHISQQKIFGKLHLIDLAGSERLKKTSAEGDRLKEAQNINKSLSALGDVISSLASKKKGHIPYRNSKLTSLLQDSLGGNSKTLMFVNVSPSNDSCSETFCSLGFAQRARKVELGKAEKNTQ
ncbi:hypothetical protein ABK040_006668 [Willaertia magna]